MPLSKSIRMQKIAENKKVKRKKNGTKEIEWGGDLHPMDVFKIPIEYLVYNKYNGRILSRTKSLETQNYKIDVETKQGNKLIQELLLKSHPSRNGKTETNIRTYGQKEAGIITKDGIVIDGNRRLMLLNKIIEQPDKTTNLERFKNFKAVILPVTLAEAPDEIRRLETVYQMGEDKKLDYNPIEKYLKAQELKKNKVSKKDIAAWMGETEGEIAKYLETMQTMDDYLDFLEYNGIYTQLDGREDWFLTLTKWLANFRGEQSKKVFDGYRNDDVDDLVLICYDYIRAKHGGDGKRFRKIAEGQRTNHIFGDKDLWCKFKELHFKKIDSIKDEEASINLNAQDLKSHLDDRDNKFKKSSDEYLKENLNDRISELENKQYQDKPEKLFNKVDSALKEVKPEADSFSKSDAQKQLKKISNKVNELLLQNNASLVLEQSLYLLKKIDVSTLSNENSDKRLGLIKEINSLSFNMKKELGG